MVDVSGCLVAQVLRMEHLLTYCHLGMSLLQLQAKESMLPQTRAVFGYQDVQVLSLTDGGKEILAQTSKGLYYSTNGGRFWVRR